MKAIEEFVSMFGAQLCLEKKSIVEKKNRYFLLNDELKNTVQKNFFYAGTYLGKIKNGKFFPSYILLRMISKRKANKTTLSEKASWLFICGRDVFKQGIIKIEGSKKKGVYTLILNKYGECLGFGRIMQDFDKETGRVAIRNVSDVGDFLRREKKL